MSGVPQPTHLAAVVQSARALRDEGDLVGARQLLEHALDTARSAYGEDHPDVLGAARLLAGIHRAAGEPAPARRVLEEALSAGRVRLGEADPLMLALAFDLGTVAEELGNRHEARRNFGRVAAAGPAVLGEDDPVVRAARDYLAGETLPMPGLPPAPRTPAITRPRTHVRAGGGAVAAVIAAVVTTAVALGAVALVRSHVGGDRAQPAAAEPSDAPTGAPPTSADPPAEAPPTRLVLARRDGSITLTWTDPTAGTVPFIVAGAPGGQARRMLASVEPGETRSTLNGLNPDLDYCFTILAVYDADRLVAGDQVCTNHRPQPSATR